MSENLRVLLVEDDPAVAKCSMKQLEELGCIFRTTRSHVAAIGVLEKDKLITTVLLDHGATNGCVVEFVTAARSIKDNLKIIGCSANDCSEEFASAGVWDFLRKPFDLPELEEALQFVTSDKHAADTLIGTSDSSTNCLRFAYREQVRIVIGPLKGLEGTFVSVRTGGKILVELESGIYMEVFQYSVDKAS